MFSASLLGKGEAWTYLLRPESPERDNTRYRGTRSVALTNKVAEGKATTEEHKVVGDGMVRKVEYVKQGDLYAGKRRTGVRAPIVASRRRNGRGAKGGREVDTWVSDKRRRNRLQCAALCAELNRPERPETDGPGLNLVSGQNVC